MDTARSVGKTGIFQKKNTWRIIFGILLLLLTILVVSPAFQNDTYYIIKLGEQVLDSGLDRSDHWAWSAQLINTYPHFLLNIIFALLYRAFGFTGVYVFVVAAGYAFALSLYHMTEKIYDKAVDEKNTSLYPFVGMIVCVIVIITFQWFIIARPQLLTFLLWLWEAWFIIRFLNTGKKRYGAAIMIIAWLCALIHATAWYFTFVLFIPFMAAVYITRFVKFLSSREINVDRFLQGERFILSGEAECKNVKKLWIVLPLSYATGLLTPTRLCYTSIIKASSGNTVIYITEHKPLVLYDLKWVLAGVLLFMVLFIFFRVKCRLDLLFLFGGTFLMALSSNRHVALFVFLGWSALYYVLFGALKYIPLNFRESIQKTVIPYLAVLALAVLGLANNNLHDFSYYNPAFVSDEAIDFLKENYDVQELRLYNDYTYGAYMLFRDMPVFIDSRVNEYTKEFDPSLERDVFNDYMSVMKLKNNWQDVIAYYDFDGFYIQKGKELENALSVDPDYEPVWENDWMIIFMKADNT